MGSTNKTQYLELPQWIGTDQPTWLGDMNDAFLKIDTGYNTVNGNASSAISQAGRAVQTANNANTAATTAQETAETAGKNASTALNTANNALEVANSANSSITSVSNRVTTLENQFTGFSSWIEGTLTNIASGWTSRGNMVNYNDDLSLLNITLRLTGNQNISSGLTIARLPSNILSKLNLSSERRLYGVTTIYFTQGSDSLTTNLDLTLSTSGSLTTQATTTTMPATQITCNVMLCTYQW